MVTRFIVISQCYQLLHIIDNQIHETETNKNQNARIKKSGSNFNVTVVEMRTSQK